MRTSGRKSTRDFTLDSQFIVEEKVVKFNGDITIKKYSKGKFLGKGGFAKCYEFVNLENKKISAAKIVAKSSLTKHRAKQKLMSEIKIHRSLHHEGIVGFEHFFEDSENVYILLEMCSNQTLNELIRRRKKLTELEVQCYLVQIINSLKYLHSHRVIHRDLKLGNLFLTDKMEVKIGDFGLATKLEFEGERKRTICGTPNYIAPEILEGKHGHSYEVDTWSLGVILYTLLIGKPPFETQDVKTTYKRIRMNAYTFPEHVIISDSAKNLIQRILHSDPSKRPKLEEVLNHQFLTVNAIPKMLPASTLACPPSSSYLKQFLVADAEIIKSHQPTRLESTAPMNGVGGGGLTTRGALKDRKNLLNTDRVTARVLHNMGYNKQGNLEHNELLSHRQHTAHGTHHTGHTGHALGCKKGSQNEEQNIHSTGAPPHTASDKILTARIQNKIYSKSKTQNTQPSSNTPSTNPTNTYNSTQNLPQTNPPLKNKPAYARSPPKQIEGGTGTPSVKGPDVWVKKWVDYSSKYGLGYLLSNGATGVFFNDSTKIVLDPHGYHFDYMERRPSDRQDVPSPHTLLNYPKDLQKKVTLLQHFRSYLEGENTANSGNSCEGAPSKKLSSSIYVKKWMRTRHAIMFRLSNKIVQVNFQDQTEIILSSESRVVTYVNKKGERLTYPLSTALESTNMEMSKRLKYTKDILTHMLNNNNNNNGSSNKASTQNVHGSTHGNTGSNTNSINTARNNK